MTDQFNPDEVNGLGSSAPEYHRNVSYTDTYTLRRLSDEGGRVTRVQFLTEYIPEWGRLLTSATFMERFPMVVSWGSRSPLPKHT